MRRLAWLAALAGLLAGVARAFRRSSAVAPPPAAADDGDPRAEELRRRLAEARTVVAEREDFESAEVTVDEAEPAGPSIEERRRGVHDAGRAAAEEMRQRGDGG